VFRPELRCEFAEEHVEYVAALSLGESRAFEFQAEQVVPESLVVPADPLQHFLRTANGRRAVADDVVDIREGGVLCLAPGESSNFWWMGR
jgi:hypothetical protein